MTVFKAHKISALCWCFVSRNLVNTFPWVVGALSDSMCVCPASWLDDVEGSSGFPVQLNPGVVFYLAPKK